MPINPRRREEYEIEFADEDIVKVRFERVVKSVVQFSVQYLAWIRNKWFFYRRRYERWMK